MKLTQIVHVLALAVFALLSSSDILAQTNRQVGDSLIRAPHISFTFGGFIPLADLNDRFGSFGTVGGNFGVKTSKNNYWGVRATLISGADVQIDGLLSNLLTESGEIIDNEGDVASIKVSGRGGMFGMHFGKVIGLSRSNPNSGLLIRGGLGSIHHKVRYDFTENHITQLEEPYLQGYDRLTWGYYASAFVGYWHMDDDQRVNFFAGLTGFGGQTFPLRTTNFDTGIPDIDPRFDGGIGIEIGWVLHVYERSPKEYWY